MVIGEGGSGGALALGVADRVLMLENSVYSVISPEGCAAILWKDASQRERAAEALKITADDLLRLKVIDEIIPEPLGGAHQDPDAAGEALREALIRHVTELREDPPREAGPPARREVRRDGSVHRGLMPSTVEVRFKGTRKDYFLWPDDAEPLRARRAVIVEVERGPRLRPGHRGRARPADEEMRRRLHRLRRRRRGRGAGAAQQVVRRATAEDIQARTTSSAGPRKTPAAR